jgi:hypothetical protein
MSGLKFNDLKVNMESLFFIIYSLVPSKKSMKFLMMYIIANVPPMDTEIIDISHIT